MKRAKEYDEKEEKMMKEWNDKIDEIAKKQMSDGVKTWDPRKK